MKIFEVILPAKNNDFITIALTMEDAKMCYHSGLCDEDVHEVCKQEYVKEQMKGYSIHDLTSVLDNYGFEYEDGKSIEDLFEDCVWLAAGDILDDNGKGVFTKVIED